MTEPGEIIAEVADRVAGARGTCVMTGAGVSAESGIPTFRGSGGFWKQHRAEDLATPRAFHEDPERVWEFYLWRRRRLMECAPNPAHDAIAEIERRVEHFDLITQNVDGLHRRAGSTRVIELHGALWRDACTRCPHARRFDERGLDDPGAERPDCSSIPTCERCGAMMRPGVVWFGEALPAEALAGVDRALDACDVVLVVGTSGVVQPAASFVEEAARRGAFTVEINVERTPLSAAVDARIHGPAGEVLPAIVRAMPGPRDPAGAT